MAMPTAATTLISSTAELEAFLSSIPPSSTLYLDLEGNCLCRHGTISLITILPHPHGVVRLIDVLSLGKSAFTTTSKDGKSLKSILEDPDIPKCLWDVRNDADALWALYQVGLASVIDIQLLENASRVGKKTYLCGLDKAIQFDLKLKFVELNLWISSKKEIKRLMPTNIFAIRPVEAKTAQYCTNDVIHLPDLHALYLRRISADWLARAMEESSRRVGEARSPTYETRSATKALGPWGSGTEKRVRSSDHILEDDDVDYYNDGPTSCRDVIDDSDYHFYYSD